MKKLSTRKDHGLCVLFLGYDQDRTSLIDRLISFGCEVWHTDKKIDCTDDFEVAISFGYRHIISSKVLENESCLTINLHLSYLPFNRGAHPNFWSFYDNTPSGVTIHLVDSGIDTGGILCQKQIFFDNGETTFVETYNRLRVEIETMFLNCWNSIANRKFNINPQEKDAGTFHRTTELPKDFAGWDADIETEIIRLHRLAQSR